MIKQPNETAAQAAEKYSAKLNRETKYEWLLGFNAYKDGFIEGFESRQGEVDALTATDEELKLRLKLHLGIS